MYLKITKSGPRTYLQIAQAYRDPSTGKPRQRHIATLGRVDELVDSELDSLIDGLLKATGRRSLAELEGGVGADTTVFERAVELGDVWAVTQIWYQLSLVQAIGREAKKRRFGVDMEKLIRVMVINRLSDPRSKLGLLEWLETVALPGVDRTEITHTNLLRAMDFLITQKDALEKELASTLYPLFASDMEVIFYDITTVRVHGEAEEEDDVRRYGKPKDGPTPQRQYAVGLVQTPEGLPITHEVFEGNVSEPKTVRGIVESLRERFPIRRLVFVADRGMLTLENLADLEAMEVFEGAPAEYIVAVPARKQRQLTVDLDRLHGELVAESRSTGAQAVREAEVNGRRVVMAYAPEIARRARRQRAKRLVGALRLATALAQKLNDQADGKKGARGRKLTDTGAKITLREYLSHYHLTRLIKVDLDDGIFTWEWDVEELRRELKLDGMLVLVSNVKTMTAAALVAQHKELGDIERGFRVVKDQLEIAPVPHRLPDRIRAHTFICFLALVIHRLLRHRLYAAQSDLSPEKLLYRLEGVQQHRVHLATGTTLTGVTTLGAEQRSLFELAGVDPPTRKGLAAAV
jgi:transposase